MQIFYTVRTGDTLGNIAFRWSIPLRSLIAANNAAAPYLIFPGQQLSMPPGISTYIVRPGDSIYSISQMYRIPINVIIEANGIDQPYVITPGMVLTVPPGVPYYTVKPGDTLYKIAAKYNVTLNGQPRPDLIMEANYGLTPDIIPGMNIAVPYPPPGGTGRLAAVIFDDLHYYLQLYDPGTGGTDSIPIDEAGSYSTVFWSPDRSRIAYAGNTGIIYIIEAINRRALSKIDQIQPPAFVNWSHDGKRLVYSTGMVIRIYDVSGNTFKTINRPGASYVQWFPNDSELLFEAKDASGISQLYRSNEDESNERRITDNRNGALNEVRLSPNGRFVLYTSPGVSVSEIYAIELATGSIYKIPGGLEGKNYYPAWSPDSARIAYSSTHFANGRYYSHIRMSEAKGEGDTALAISSCYATPVVWSPDSNKIAYLSGCREVYPPVEVWSIDLRKPVPINILYGYTFYNIDW